MKTQRTTNNFSYSLEDGYIYERLWGAIGISEAQDSAEAVLELARESGCRKYLMDVEGIVWTNDPSIRPLGLHLMSEGRKYFDRMAVVTQRQALIYMVRALAISAGLRAVKAFSTREEAEAWLLS